MKTIQELEQELKKAKAEEENNKLIDLLNRYKKYEGIGIAHYSNAKSYNTIAITFYHEFYLEKGDIKCKSESLRFNKNLYGTNHGIEYSDETKESYKSIPKIDDIENRVCDYTIYVATFNNDKFTFTMMNDTNNKQVARRRIRR